jgi:hypothetical protein
MYGLGAVGGSLSVVGWGLLNTYMAIVQGNFRNRHPKCHSIADMANEVGGKVFREFVGALFIIAYVLCTGSGILGVSIALNTFSTHGGEYLNCCQDTRKFDRANRTIACTVWFTFVATILVIICASVRKFHQLGTCGEVRIGIYSKTNRQQVGSRTQDSCPSTSQSSSSCKQPSKTK